MRKLTDSSTGEPQTVKAMLGTPSAYSTSGIMFRVLCSMSQTFVTVTELKSRPLAPLLVLAVCRARVVVPLAGNLSVVLMTKRWRTSVAVRRFKTALMSVMTNTLS